VVEQPEGWNEYRRLVLDSLQQLNRRVEDLGSKIDALHKDFAPLDDYIVVRQRVEQLWNRDLQGRPEWEEMVPRVRTLWQERSERQGTVRGYRVALGVLSAIVAMLTIVTLLHGFGINLSFGKG
jgi:hypothetical protein